MTRLFGVLRSRDQLSIRNRITTRVLRHPTLHEFHLDQLRQLTEADCELYKEVALYPILLLLARLYPSSVDESDAHNEVIIVVLCDFSTVMWYLMFQLEHFIPHVKLCARNRILKTRELTAKALVPLVPVQRRYALVHNRFWS
ncbi:hypothetical protein CBL_03861 [Carabus blaptoides fortunei]